MVNTAALHAVNASSILVEAIPLKFWLPCRSKPLFLHLPGFSFFLCKKSKKDSEDEGKVPNLRFDSPSAPAAPTFSWG